MCMHPDQQCVLNFSRTLLRVVLAQCSCATYKVVNPVLGISIFDASVGLLILYRLCDTQTSQFNLMLDFFQDFIARSKSSRLYILKGSRVWIMTNGGSPPWIGHETQYLFLYIAVCHQHGIFYMDDFHFHRCGRRLRSEQGCHLDHSLHRSWTVFALLIFRGEPLQASHVLTYQLFSREQDLNEFALLNKLLDTVELLGNIGNWWCWDKMYVEFLLQ